VVQVAAKGGFGTISRNLFQNMQKFLLKINALQRCMQKFSTKALAVSAAGFYICGPIR
jgi:hypothetical protein